MGVPQAAASTLVMPTFLGDGEHIRQLLRKSRISSRPRSRTKEPHRTLARPSSGSALEPGLILPPARDLEPQVGPPGPRQGDRPESVLNPFYRERPT